MSNSDPIEAATRRLSQALEALEAATERRREADRADGALADQVHVLGSDRARLASQLDEAAARARALEAPATFSSSKANPPSPNRSASAAQDSVRVASLDDVHRPKLPIVWEKGIELPRFEIPTKPIFAKERWTGAPALAGYRRGAGAVLWMAVSPGERGYERFPYLLQALADLGLEPPFRSARLWAFFDSAYRSRVDLDYFAARWRAAGIAALQVAAWHFYDPDPERDAI